MKKPLVATAVVRAIALLRHAIALRAFRSKVRASDKLGAELGYLVEYTDAEVAILTRDPDAARIFAEYKARQALRAKVDAYNDSVANGEARRARAMYLLG